MRSLTRLALLAGFGTLLAAPGMAQIVPPAPLPGAASARMVSCPPVLQSFVAVDTSGGKAWKLGGRQQVAPLKGARLFIGDVAEESLRAEAEVKPLPGMDRARKVFVQSWRFDDRQRGKLVLVCDYSGTENFLMRGLDEGYAQCLESDPLDKSGQQPIEVVCQ